jgi:hypothetical protein
MRKISLILNTKSIFVHHNHQTEHTNTLCAKLQSFDFETDGIYQPFEIKWFSANDIRNKQRHFSSIMCLSYLTIMTVF